MSLGIEYTTQSGIDHIDQLISYRKWTLGEDRTMTWTITKEDAIFSDEPYGIKGELPYFKAISNPLTVANINKAMQAFSSVLDINLKYIDETPAQEATIRFNAYADPTGEYTGGVWAYGAYTHSWGGDVWTSWYAGMDVFTAMHEIGHALGLDHPGHITRVNVPGFTTLETVMSYHGTRKQVALDETGKYVGAVASDALGIYDIAALQYIHGANKNHNAGNTTYSYDPNIAFYTTLWDGGGEDTLDLSNYGHGASISLLEGTYSSINYFVPAHRITQHTYLGENAIGIAYGTVIENAIGTQGDDVIHGNAASNKLVGGAGNDALYGHAGDDRLEGGNGDDVLDGGLGADIMIGGLGDDTYHVDDVDDVVIEAADGGIDTVLLSTDSRSSKRFLNMENFIAVEGSNARAVSGNALNNTVIGNSLDNQLQGYEGDDVLIGGRGNDTLNGGSGNDTFVFYRGDGNDRLLQGAGKSEDVDTLSFKNINSDQLWFSADVNRRNLIIKVIGTNDSVTVSEYFSQRENVLDIVEVADGKFLDTANIDRLIDAMSVLTPPPFGQTELSPEYRRALDPALGSSWLSKDTEGRNIIQGDSSDNLLQGSDGDDVIYGEAGADVMVGGLGNDTYYVDDVNDVVIEALDGGVDTVHLSIDSRGSKRFLNIENFIAIEGSNANAVSGNALNNTVIGNSLDNRLLGCEGDDVLIGGRGNDTLVGGSGNDTFLFSRGDGNDVLLQGVGKPEDIDTLSFKDINSDQLWFSADARRKHLVINVIGTNDSVTVSEYFAQRKNVLDIVEVADGKFLDTANIDKLIDAMAAFAPPALGQTSLPSNYQQALAPVLAAAWT